MSKGNNYQKYYNQHKNEEAINEPIVKPQTEEVHAAEETAEPITEVTSEEVAAEPVPEKEVAEKKQRVIVVNANLVNLRKAPSKNAEILNIVRKGTKLEASAKLPEWTKVHFNGQDGYMMSKFLKEI